MPEKVVMQVRMDRDIKEQAQKVYEDIGTSFTEAIRVFAVQSIKAKGYPFAMHAAKSTGKSFGALHKYANPDLIPLEKEAMERELAEKHE